MSTVSTLPGYNKSLVFSSSALGLLVFGAGITTLGSVAPWLKTRFLLDDIQTGTLFSILPIGILLGSLVFGPLCDRFGYKYLFIGCCILMAAGFFGISGAASISILSTAVLLFGIGGGAMNGASAAAVADSNEGGKGAQLSLLGIFFGLGALGMPFILATLAKVFDEAVIISSFGWISVAAAVLYLFISFPPSKLSEGFSFSKVTGLFTDKLIWLIAFFLFCQSSFEAIINNWAISFLIQEKSIPATAALYALSIYIGGYTVMRLLLGTVFRNTKFNALMAGSIALLVMASLLLRWLNSYEGLVAALIMIGFGLSAGFPLMLGVVGSRYAAFSGTAFSFVLVIALIGNMLVNYMLGIISREYGIAQLTSVALCECVAMILLLWGILRKLG